MCQPSIIYWGAQHVILQRHSGLTHNHSGCKLSKSISYHFFCLNIFLSGSRDHKSWPKWSLEPDFQISLKCCKMRLFEWFSTTVIILPSWCWGEHQSFKDQHPSALTKSITLLYKYKMWHHGIKAKAKMCSHHYCVTASINFFWLDLMLKYVILEVTILFYCYAFTI